MSNPYRELPERNFWKLAVGSRDALEIDDLWRPKFRISADDRIATAGSCFAQHISRAMMAAGLKWLDSEPAPHWLKPEQAHAYNYGAFTFRTGNIYTSALLRQWLEMASDTRPPSHEIWSDGNGRFYDPLRPAIEPRGFASAEEALLCRQQTLNNIRRSLPQIDLFVFTLGLTEGWRNRTTKLVYPMAPGTLAGAFDSASHAFHNYGFLDILTDITAVIELLQRYRPSMRFLFTVSPVPLTATAENNHVLVATIHSKSILRAVAGELAATRADVDYFPSYEIISAFPFAGRFYERNKRDISREGVAHVMKVFFRGLQSQGADAGVMSPKAPATPPQPSTATSASEDDVMEDHDIACEDAVLDAFAPRS